MKRYHVTTFGCQMNVHDSERVKGLLESLGMGEAVTPEDADLLVVNQVGADLVFDSDVNAATLLGRDGSAVEVPLGDKNLLAHAVWDAVVHLLVGPAS